MVKIGNHGILKRLLKEVDEVDEQEGVLVRIAVKYGQKECLRVLLEDGRVDPGHRGNEALDMARKRGEWEMVGMLEEDCRVVERERSKNVVPEKWVRA